LRLENGFPLALKLCRRYSLQQPLLARPGTHAHTFLSPMFKLLRLRLQAGAPQALFPESAKGRKADEEGAAPSTARRSAPGTTRP